MLIPVTVMLVLYWTGKRTSQSWAAVVDAQLLPHVLAGKRGKKSRWPVILILFIALLVIIALAGPAWQKREQPVFKQNSTLVVALDLSASMNVTDIRPSRLERARLKLIDLLKMRHEGQTALIAYAASPFTVTPLTDDIETITSLLPSLTTDIMPAQGSRADLAVSKAIELFDNAGLARGDILLVTDGVNETSLSNLRDRHMPGFRLSVLAVGTQEGAPIPAANAGFIKDRRGAIVVASTDFSALEDLATSKDGHFQIMSIDDRDIQAIEAMVTSNAGLMDHQQTQFKADRWREEGPWLLLLVTPLVALAFRRGFILTLLLALLVLPTPQPVFAEQTWWDRLWKNGDQLGAQALRQGDAESAVDLFQQPHWKAAAQYRAGQYEDALKTYDKGAAADSLYNRGNTQARLGDLEQALQSYDQVLEKNPEHEDAKHNRDVVKQALEQRQQGQDSSQQDSQQQDKEEEEKDEEKDEEKRQQDKQKEQQGKQGDQQQDESQQGKGQQQGEAQQQQQGESEQQQADKQSEDEQQAFQQQQDQNDEQAGEDEQQQAERKQQDQEEKDQQQDQDEKDQQQARPDQQEKQPRPVDTNEELSQQAEAQWLRRIPDDPGGLLRNKFRFQYRHQRSAQQESELW